MRQKWYCPWCLADSHEPAVNELVTCAECTTNGCLPAELLLPALATQRAGAD